MRNAFIRALISAAEADERIWLLTGDLGYSVLEPFADRWPDRYVNVGIAEQNMTGVAAGLAMAGKIPVTYSIANFPTLRCLEQLRNDVCYHGLNVKVVAVGGGMAYGSLGYTHHAVEDLAIMRVLPAMKVAAPGDAAETEAVTTALLSSDGPGYLRLGKAGEPAVHSGSIVAPVGQPIRIRSGVHVTLLSTGAVLPMVVQAAERLAELGISAGVLSLPWISPIDADALARVAMTSPALICVEEHGPGGLFAAVAESLAQAGIVVPLRSVRLSGEPSHIAGRQEWLRASAGVSLDDVIGATQAVLETPQPVRRCA